MRVSSTRQERQAEESKLSYEAGRHAPVSFRALEPRFCRRWPTGFTETHVAAGLTSPSAVAVPDGRMFIAQQSGTIRIVHDDELQDQPFATLSVDSDGERGLTGITLDPNFASNGYVYVYYTASSPSSHNRVSRLTAQGDTMVPGSEMILFELPNLSTVGNPVWHMGGAIHFSPIDGKLYVSVGDHQDTSKPQSLNSPFGKILRINADGSIPTDNPFYNSTTGNNRAIYAYGLRNPFTTAFQPETGSVLHQRRRGVGLGGNQPGRRRRELRLADDRRRLQPVAVSELHATDLRVQPRRRLLNRRRCVLSAGQRSVSRSICRKVFLPGLLHRHDVLPGSDQPVGRFDVCHGHRLSDRLDRRLQGSMYYLSRGDATGGRPRATVRCSRSPTRPRCRPSCRSAGQSVGFGRLSREFQSSAYRQQPTLLPMAAE